LFPKFENPLLGVFSDGTRQRLSPSNSIFILDPATSSWELGPSRNTADVVPVTTEESKILHAVTMSVLNDRLTIVDTSRLPELQIERIAVNGSWEVSTKRLDPLAFKRLTRVFGGRLRVR